MNNIKHPLRYILSFFTKPVSYASYNGIKLSFDSPVVTPWIRDAIYKGFYESDECKLLRLYLDPSDVVLEIGAGIGLTSAIVASKTVISTHIEANPRLIDLVITNISLNSSAPGQHVVKEAAVTAVDSNTGRVDLHAGSNFWNAALVERDVHDEAISQTALYIRDVFQEKDYSFLIMDVEGYELEILDNNPLPHAIKKVMIELHPKVIGVDGVQKCISILESQGFSSIDTSANSVYLLRLDKSL